MSVRSAAVRRAAQIRGERAAAFAAREAKIEQRAVEFLEASARAENVVEAARRRCEQIMATAQVAAEHARGRAATAVADLEGLAVLRGEIAQITGLTGRQVRELLASRTPPLTASGPGEPDSTVVAGGDEGAAEHGAAPTREGTEDADLSGLNPAGEVMTPWRMSGPSPEPDRYWPSDWPGCPWHLERREDPVPVHGEHLLAGDGRGRADRVAAVPGDPPGRSPHRYGRQFDGVPQAAAHHEVRDAR